jgi:hypothetical protein
MFGTAPYIPPIDPSDASDTQNFDDTFLDMEPVINDENDMDTDQEREQIDQEPTDGEDSVATPSQCIAPRFTLPMIRWTCRRGRTRTSQGVAGTAVADIAVIVRHEEPTSEPKAPEARTAALPPSTPHAEQSP